MNATMNATTNTRTRAPLGALALSLLALALAGCVSAEPLQGTTFAFEIAAHGTTKRFVSLEARADAGASRGRTVELSDLTTIDDDADARRRIRIEPSATEKGAPRPGSGHLNFATVAVRPIDLVILYRGHEDIYHLSFPREGGVLVEPSSGEFTHIVVRAVR